MPCFAYGEKEISYLKGKDIRLGKAIDRIGRIEREVIPDFFEALVHAIIGQQISTKAQITIWERMRAALGPVTPEKIREIPQEELQRFGITMRKAGYLQSAAGKILSGELDLASLRQKPDDVLCRELQQLRGVGLWTAEMLLLFSLQRPDVLSYGDLAIRRGMRMLYRHREITPERFERYRRRYSPYGSVASLYLWAVAGGAAPELDDPAPGKI